MSKHFASKKLKVLWAWKFDTENSDQTKLFLFKLSQLFTWSEAIFFEKLVIAFLAVERISVWFGHLEAHAWKDNMSLSLLKVSIDV